MWRLVEKRMFDILELRYQHSEGDFIGCKHANQQIGQNRLNRTRRCCQNPDGVRGWLLGKNGVLTHANQGLKGSEPIKAFTTSDIVRNYRLRGEAIRHTAPVDFVIHLALGREVKNPRGKFKTYPRPINRILQSEFVNERNSRWGMEDTYDHTRMMSQLDEYNG